MTFNQPRNVGVLAKPLTVEGVDDSDPAGHVPRDLLIKGTRIVIPYWIDPVPNDELWVVLRQNGVERRLYTEFYPTPLTVPFLYFDLTPQHLDSDGIAYLYYKIWKGSGGTDDPSPERQLTIDHTPLVTLPEPVFPHATLWGYLNNSTKPSLKSGATVRISAFTTIAAPGDIARIHWRGYSSLNGSGPEVPGTYGVWDKLLSATDIANGFDHVVPYMPHIISLFDNDSAVVVCQLLRGGRLIAESNKALVKIDQVTPGESGPSGLNEGEREMTAQEKVTFKARANPPQLGVSANGIFATAISVDTVADDFIHKSQLDTNKIIIKLAAFADPLDGDDCDVWAAVEGQALVQIASAVALGPVAGRPDPFLIELDAALFPDLAQPAGPTAYIVKVFVYKDGAGTDDPSNTLRVVIDTNSPFGLKFPTKRLTPPVPAAAFTNAPIDAQRTVNEAWMQLPANANAELVFGVGYANRRPDDELELHFVSGGVDVVAFKGTVPAGGTVSVPNTELRKLPNGRVMAHFFWTDHAGNRSASSTPAALLTLGLALDPVLRKAPLVPASDPNASTTVYLDNFLATGNIQAIVERAFIDNLEPGDQVMIYVEDTADPTNFKELGPVPIVNADVPFTLDYKGFFEDLFGIYEEATEFKIWTVVVRGTNTFESPELFFWIDLYPSGGVYPELPGDVNPAFALPVVTGASNTPNDLQPGDRDKPGKIEVTLKLTDPPLSSTETAKFYLNGKFVGEVTPFNDMTTFSHVVTAADIAVLPTPSTLAYWTRQKTGIDKNVIKSSPETVLVSGKKIDLLTPTIRIRNPLKDQMDCFAMNNAATDWKVAISVPKDAVNLPQGTVITMNIEAYSDEAGTNLIPGTADSQPYTILAPGTPDVAGVGSAAIFKLAQPRRGAVAWIKYWYTANIGGVQTSIPIIKKLDTITSSAEYCDRTPVPLT
ncbi:hypothetical protein HNR03_003588 [Pseudomonas sp. JAI111]|uniref:hypothetical protein n=1 Tax=Pseudomonas sp. JAI111 TaxID=2735913 RepID=UPI0021697731|nr:hypothetical protein [Pseudomonas sp. JAI111]MCS3838980.1 hypothetical protein [Pseudomonas sp. JAI111]